MNKAYDGASSFFMEAPAPGMSRPELIRTIQDYIAQKYENKPHSEKFRCRACGMEIQFTTCHVKIHYSKCINGTEAEDYPLPYCPICEGYPRNTNTCIHVSS